MDETRGARFFTKLDLAMTNMRFRIWEDDQFKTSFRVPGGQYEFRVTVGAFGLHGMSSVLMRFMHDIYGRPDLEFDSTSRARPASSSVGPTPPMRALRAGVLRRHPDLSQDA